MIFTVAESSYGEHHEISLPDEFKHISATFICNIKSDGKFANPPKKLFKMIIDEYEANDDVFLMFDLDQMGELMSNITRDYLVECGIPKESIYRVPLCENGYMTAVEFLSEEYMEATAELFSLEREFINSFKGKNLPSMGFRKALALDKLINIDKGDEIFFEPKYTGSCSASFVYFYNERDSL